MRIEFPYEIEITRKEDLQTTIFHMCEQCPLKMACDEEIEQQCKTMKMAMVYNFGDNIQEIILKKNHEVINLQAKEFIRSIEIFLDSDIKVNSVDSVKISRYVQNYGIGFVKECFEIAVARYGKAKTGGGLTKVSAREVLNKYQGIMYNKTKEKELTE